MFMRMFRQNEILQGDEVKNFPFRGGVMPITRAKTRRLAKIYENCFREEPWCEVFASGEAVTWLREMICYPGNISLGWRVYLGKIVGAIFAFPLVFKEDVAKFLPQEIDASKVIYIADIFVKKSYRKQGIASALQKQCLDIAKEKGFTHALARTNLESKMRPILAENEYALIQTQEVISNKQVNGKIVPLADVRGIFLRTL